MIFRQRKYIFWPKIIFFTKKITVQPIETNTTLDLFDTWVYMLVGVCLCVLYMCIIHVGGCLCVCKLYHFHFKWYVSVSVNNGGLPYHQRKNSIMLPPQKVSFSIWHHTIGDAWHNWTWCSFSTLGAPDQKFLLSWKNPQFCNWICCNSWQAWVYMWRCLLSEGFSFYCVICCVLHPYFFYKMWPPSPQYGWYSSASS